MPVSLFSKGAAHKTELNAQTKEEAPKSKETTRKIVAEQKDTVEIKSVEKKAGTFSLQGLDIDAIEQGIIRVKIPLKGGKFGFPGPFADAQVKVRNHSSAQLSIGINKEKDRAAISGAHLTFQPAIKLKNPSSAFQPTQGLLSRVFNIDFIKDKAADVVLSGIRVTKDGKIHVEGFVKIGILGKKDLGAFLPAKLLPTVNLNIDQLIGRVTSEERTKQSQDKSDMDIEKLLHAVGAVVEEAAFYVEAHCEPRQLALSALGVHVWTDKAPIDAKVRGKAVLTRNNSFHLNIEPEGSEIRFSEGKIKLNGEVRVANVAPKNPTIESHIAFKFTPNGTHARIDALENQSIRADLVPGQNQVSGHAFVFRDTNGQITLKDASCVAAKVAGTVLGPQNFAAQDVEAKIENVHFDAEVRANLSANSNGLDVSSGELSAHLGASNPAGSYKGIGVSAPGEIFAAVNAPMWRFPLAARFPSAHGRVGFKMTPSAETVDRAPDLEPFETHGLFDLRSDKTLRIDVIRQGLAEFLKPFSNILSRTRAMSVVPGQGCAPIGSREFRKRCEEIGDSKIRHDNGVQLLIDGTQSLPQRLALIKGAQKSICMQTLVFKDDISGMQIADALCEAAARGVEVRVIVDALGNASSLMELVAMNPVYGKLQEGGVKVAVHNNSLGEGIRTALMALSNCKKLSEHLNLDDLSNPKKLFSVLNLVARAAIGEFDLSLEKSDQELLVAGLTKVLSGGKQESSVELVRNFAKITEDNVLDLAEFADILKHNAHLNFRTHEKYLTVDGKATIIGGLNTADDYLLGTWRDTDILVKGKAAADAFNHFAVNWQDISNEKLTLDENDHIPIAGDYRVQMVHSRPRVDEGSNIVDLMVECLGSLQKGENAYIESAYFLPSGRAKVFEDALIQAAQRGVNVHVLANSEKSIDVKMVAQASKSSFRRLLENGVRVFECSGERMLHSKSAVFGQKVAVVGSWNADNRSSSLNSEAAAFVHSSRFAKKVEEMILSDMDSHVAHEIFLDDIDHLPIKTELKNTMSVVIGDLL